MSEVIDVVGIGNAIVDVLAHCDDGFIERMALTKGAMTLIGTERAEQLYQAMGPAIEISGGSAANTTVGVASLGGKAAFIGKVGNDQLGGIFRHDVRAAGVRYDIAPATSATPTARSMILVTPDAERTMNTYLGACHELTPDDIDPHLIQRARVTYMEGYLWDPPLAKEAFLKAARIAHDAGQEVALTLSDSFCVQRYLKEFQDLVMNHVDILFANIGEITALWETNDWNEAARVTQQHCDLAALTRSEHGFRHRDRRRDDRDSRLADRPHRRPDRRRRSLRFRLPVRLYSRPRIRGLRTHRLAGRGRDHFPYRRAARDAAR